MNYLDYYNLLRLKNVSRQGLGFIAILIGLFVFQIDLFFSDVNSINLGLGFYFLVSLFIGLMYALQIRNESNNIIFQLPVTSKQRVKYDYINVIFMYLSVTIFFISVFYLLALIFRGLLETSDAVDSTGFIGNLYAISFYLTIFGLYMPLAYVTKTRKRNAYAAIFYAVITIINMSVMWILTGNFLEFGDIRVLIEASNTGIYISITYFVISMIILIFSYKKSIALNKYK